MRILHLIYDDVANPWLGGGGAIRTREINRRLAAQGHQVTVICGRYPGAKSDKTVDGVRYRRVGWPEILVRRGGYMGSRIAYVLAALRLLKRSCYDIVVEDVSPYSPIFSPIWRRRGSQAIASVQNLSGRHATGKFGLSLRGLLPTLVERPLLRVFKSAVVVSPGIARQMAPWWRGRRGTKLAVIPNSAGSAEFYQDFGAANLPDRGAILYLGRIDIYQKGLDRLIAAYSQAAPRLPGVGLLIAGAGPAEDEHELERLIAAAGLRLERGDYVAATGTVTLVGKLEPHEAAKALGRSMFMVMPSRYEAWPITAIEAGACSKPVLGSDIVGVRDAAPAAAHGMLIADGDGEAMAAAMVELASNSELRRTLGERGRTWAERFSWDALAARQEEFYLETLSGAGREHDRQPLPV